MQLNRSHERGDTLIEVLLAMALLGLVSVGVFSVMHRGVGEAQNSLERSQVRSLITQQTELVNYLRDQYVTAIANGASTTVYPASLWGQIKTRATANQSATISEFDDCGDVMANSFYINKNASNQYEIVSFTSANLNPPTFARPGAGLWIEPVASPNSTNPAYQKYVDLYVKACWAPISGNVEQTMSTVVRLYDK